MEKLQIETNDMLSINDLKGRMADGFSVIRSAHVGNLSPYNLTLADAGVPMLLVDHNVAGVDTTYFPGMELTQSSEKRIADDGSVSLRTVTREGKFLDEHHVAALNEAFPDATFFTNSEYIRRNESVAGEIAKLATVAFPNDFVRLVQPDGVTQRITDVVDLVPRLGIVQLNDNPRAEEAAVLMPNMVNIMINFVVEALESEKDTQYHVSGAAMALYIQEKAMKASLQSFYEIIKAKASFGSKLPDTLNVQIVPATSARFATTERYANALSDVFSELEVSRSALKAIAEERKAFFTSGAKRDKQTQVEFEQRMNERKYIVDCRVVGQLNRTPGLFAGGKADKGFMTQYDILEGGGMYVARQNTELPMNELAALAKQLMTLRDRTKM